MYLLKVGRTEHFVQGMVPFCFVLSSDVPHNVPQALPFILLSWHEIYAESVGLKEHLRNPCIIHVCVLAVLNLFIRNA